MSEPSENKANATENWYESMEKITSEREQYQYMLDHDILTDCTFLVGPEDGETREFKAHRVHIARVSPVFEAMLLTGEMVEAKTGHVRVTDLSPNTFQLLLSFTYGKECKMTNFQEAQDLLYAAHKYQIKLLLESCVTRMRSLISPSNIWAAFETADLLQNERLKKMCIQVLQRDTLRYISDPGFLQVTEENVALLLEQDELNVEDELLLVNIIVHWARHAARQRGLTDNDEGVRAVLKPRLLSLFRFLAMSPQQFTFGPGVAGWLTSEEKFIITECLQSGDCGKMPQHLSAVAHKRKIVTNMAVQFQGEGNLICKRDVIRSRPHVKQEKRSCCTSWRTKFCNACLHAKLIFRVKSKCTLLGFQCASRRRTHPATDPTALSHRNLVYKELICYNVQSFKYTLSTDYSLGMNHLDDHLEQEIEYNSTISVMLRTPVPLVTDSWFAVEVKYCDVIPPGGEYPNPSRASSVRTSAGVEFEFNTEHREGFFSSENDGVFESLIFSL